MSKLILHVAIPVPVHHHFDYLAPENISKEKLKPGIRLKVPWGKNEIIGILLNISDNSGIHSKKLKKVNEILDDEPLFSEAVFHLLKFSSAYYHHPIGEVFEAAMPVLLRQGKNTTYRCGYTEEFEDLPEAAPVLSQKQIGIIQKILSKLHQFQTFLLFGVTGSGKTEIYLQIIEKILSQQKQALVLVPEIGLTPQTISRFEKRFLVNISVLHSGLSDRERHDSWMQAKNGDVSIIIGTRSAIFTPLKVPGVIIIDEEHDLSFKQQDGFRYSARDLAVMRGQLENIPIILGSATPSLESVYNAKLKRYELLTLPERAGTAVHPIFRLIDMKNQPKQKKQNFLAAHTIEIIQKHLFQQGQVLIFLNRRGFSPVLICRQCGWMAQCKRCDARMTLHQKPYHLQCHHCLSSRPVDTICADCNEKDLMPLGVGTERLEEDLQQYFPDIPVVRIDRDSTRKKDALKNKLAEILRGKPCILVGTQMLAKGHHFPRVSLSVIVNCDSGLYGSDFRGLERMAQLILQVGGRSGRAEKQGEVILQTYHPEHPLLNKLLEKGYEDFAEAALKEREEARFPPYYFLGMIRSESVDIEMSLHFLTEIKNLLSTQEINLLGPIPAPMQKKSGKHRAQLLLQTDNRQALKKALDFLVANVLKLKFKSRVRWSIDVDPLEMY